VRGGPIEVLRHPPSGDSSRIGRLIAEFADGSVLPAAGSVGVHCTRPAFGPMSFVTHAAEMLFTQFADTVDGEWPFSEASQELWEELVFSCLKEQVGIDRNELAKWLADSGWDGKIVALLVDKFFTDSRWLAKRLAMMVP
jgi:hypothetical protein